MRLALIAAAAALVAASLCCGGPPGPKAAPVPVESAGVVAVQPTPAPSGAVSRGRSIALAEPGFILRSADGQVMLGVGAAATVAWDGGTGEELWRVDEALSSADISADGSTGVLLDGDARTVRIVDARTGAERSRFQVDEGAWDTTLTPRGSHVVVADYEGLVVFDGAGSRVSTIRSDWSLLENPWISADGDTLYFSDDGHEVAWDLAAGRERGRFGDGGADVFREGPGDALWTFPEDAPPHRYDAATLVSQGPVPCSVGQAMELGWMMDLSPSARWLLLGGEIVDPTTCERVLYVTDEDADDALFGPGEASVWVAGSGRVEQWELVGEEEVWALGGPRRSEDEGVVLAATAITADGAHVAEVRHGGVVTLWHARDRAQRWTAVVPGCEQAAEAGGDEMDCDVDRAGVVGDEVWVSLDSGAVGVFAVRDGAARVLPLEEGLMAVDRTADGRWVSTDYQDVLRVRAPDGAALPGMAWEVAGCDEVAVSPDGQWIAVESGDELVVLDSTTGERRVLTDLSDTFVLQMDISSLGVLAVVDFDDRVTAWDLATGERLWEKTGIIAPDSARFTADGAILVLASLSLRVLDAATGAGRVSVVGPSDYSFDAFDLSPDGRWVAATKQWDTGDTLWVIDLGRLQ